MIEEPNRTPVTFTRVKFRRFKALKSYSLNLRHMNVLVGPNNSGKSTVIGAFRVLAAGLRRANAKRPEWLQVGESARLAYKIPDDVIPISTANIHTDYAESETNVIFELSNGNELELVFSISGECFLVPNSSGHALTTTNSFRTQFPVSVGVVPVLGPVEQEEELVQEATVREGLASYSRRASRHFRSYWFYHPEVFEPFRARLKETWPGLDLQPPEVVDPPYGKRLGMFVDEARVPKELFWAGFGYQVWCQILTHVIRESGSSVLVIDEPEIYLHPELQRQLVSILRDSGPDILMATHSSEIVGEAEPRDLVIVNKHDTVAYRVAAGDGVQRALTALGSVHNSVLTQSARTRRVLFVEGEDFKLLGRFARRLNLKFLAAGTDFAVQPTDGYPSADALRGLCKGMSEAIGGELRFAGVFDRDYRSSGEVAAFRTEISGYLSPCHVLERKELENYLLEPSVLDRAIRRAVDDRVRRGGTAPARLESAEAVLARLTDDHRLDVQGQLVATAIRENRGSGQDHSATTKTATATFESRWSRLPERMNIVPGKTVFNGLVAEMQSAHGINITARDVIDAFHVDEIPPEIATLLRAFEQFRISNIT